MCVCMCVCCVHICVFVCLRTHVCLCVSVCVILSSLKSSPLLLAASSGGLSAVKCLISLDADIRRPDGQGNNMVTLAALRFHTNVLEYLIEWNNPNVPVWKVLVGECHSVIVSTILEEPLETTFPLQNQATICQDMSKLLC